MQRIWHVNRVYVLSGVEFREKLMYLGISFLRNNSDMRCLYYAGVCEAGLDCPFLLHYELVNLLGQK